MPKKKQRQMTEGELNDYIANMQKTVGAHMDAIQRAVPPGYKLTLVARHPIIEGAGFVFTKDTDLEGVANEILAKDRTLKSVKDDEAKE